ncbi:protein FAM151B-like isoform X2 [Sitodiplosis mosellana]|uniref:protein FAM151B-like isoform X2 n=1 Tax=Sitodiplosis mosellana TaxID=263140 RepID=UPI00244470AF|nr:protein FAM151B-like isoform X2 [Sitodiplosis mosellana]
MLWIFVLAFIMPISHGSSICCGNLAEVKWAHAVNSHDELQQALTNDKVQMIEADVVFGYHVPKPETTKPDDNKPVGGKPEATKAKANEGDGKPASPAASEGSSAGSSTPAKIPILAHPPTDKSDLSLEEFLDAVVAYNMDAQTANKSVKGVKLDFKQIEALKSAVQSWKPKDLKHLWINADIITGPGKAAGDEVNAKEFFGAVLDAKENLVNKTLSIGWTTELGKDKISYNQTYVDAMKKAIKESEIPVGYPITFPVRAAIAAESKDSLKNLFDEVSKDKRKVTFTIWSGKNDTDLVDKDKLQDFINTFTVKKVYVDVPEDLESKLNLKSGAATFIKFGLFNLVAIAFAMFFRNGLY